MRTRQLLLALAIGSLSLNAPASEALFTSLCSACHDNSVHPKGLVYNAAGNAAIISRVNALGMGSAGSAEDFASIAAWLDADKRMITLAPVAASGPTVIRLEDIKVSAAVNNAHLKVVTGIETVTPPAKGTVTYTFAN